MIADSPLAKYCSLFTEDFDDLLRDELTLTIRTITA